MQSGLLEGGADDVRCCITVDLCLRLLQELLDAGITRVRLGILQLDDVGVSYVLVDLALGRKEDVGITPLVVQFGDGAVELRLAGQCQGEPMDKGLPLLPVSLGGKTLQTVGHIGEKGLELPVVGHQLLLVPYLIFLIGELILVIGSQQVTEQLFPHHLIGDHEAGLPSAGSSEGDQSEVIEQADEVVLQANLLGREMGLDVTRDVSLLHQPQDDGGIMLELLVLSDEHPYLLIVETDVGIQHLLGNLIPLASVFVDEVEHHVGVVHGR